MTKFVIHTPNYTCLYEIQSVITFVGGRSRVCMLDNEKEIVAGRMRASGDHGRYGSDGLLYYMGRIDKQVKRLGHRINLDTIQQVRNAWMLPTCMYHKCVHCTVQSKAYGSHAKHSYCCSVNQHWDTCVHSTHTQYSHT